MSDRPADSSPESALRASLRKKLGAFTLDVAFDAPLSGVTALFGPSGSGKTTALRCLAGLERPKGSLFVGDRIWQDDRTDTFVPAHRRPVGLVFQDGDLFPHLTVAGNLRYAERRARLRSGPAATDSGPSLSETASMLGLSDLLERRPERLSGGERKRAAIARALLSRPRLLLMDEPLAGLDLPARKRILDLLRSLVARLSLPVFYVSHDPAEVVELADRMIVLDRGRVADSGPVDEVFARLDGGPERAFEPISVLVAEVIREDVARRATRLALGGRELIVPGGGLPVGAKARLRVRARDVSVATERPRGISIRNVLEGVVVEIETPDGSPFADARIDVGGATLRARLTLDAVAELGLAPGTPVFALLKGIAVDRGL